MKIGRAVTFDRHNQIRPQLMGEGFQKMLKMLNAVAFFILQIRQLASAVTNDVNLQISAAADIND